MTEQIQKVHLTNIAPSLSAYIDLDQTGHVLDGLARRIAANVAKLPELLQRRASWRTHKRETIRGR
jgi:hypothetical protein